MASSKIYDVLIIGSGPGGLSTALGLARQTYTALVFNSNQYRNAPASHMHNVLTWDHKSPAAFRAAAKEGILERYDTIQFKDVKIVSAAKKENGGGFEVVDEFGIKYQGRKLALATGVTDDIPKIKGFRELWGSLVFHCLFCHGFEERGVESAGVLGLNSWFMAETGVILEVVRKAARLAKRVTVYTHGDGEFTEKVMKEFKGKAVTIESRKIAALEKEDKGVRVWFDHGESKKEGFLASAPPTRINGPFHEQLGLDVDKMGFIKTTQPFNETSVPGVFAVGDCGTMMTAVPQAMAMGSMAAAGMASQLGASEEL